MTNKTATIRSLNDQFRRHTPDVDTLQGRVLLTRGIRTLCDTNDDPAKHLPDLFHLTRSYEDFSPENDPHNEHDFGVFQFLGQKCFWKIDYFDLDLLYGSDDPSDPAKTKRVLTIMLAEEY